LRTIIKIVDIYLDVHFFQCQHSPQGSAAGEQLIAPEGTNGFVEKETSVKLLKTAILMAMMLMIAAPFAIAGACSSDCKASCCEKTEIEVFGSARYRLEVDGKSFAEDANMDWMQYMRSRLGVKAHRGNSGMVFELQDSRILGEDPGTLSFSNGNWTGPRNDFGVRQAYMWHKPCEKGAIKLGRFGLNMHNQRLVGQVGWHNVGRTTEGLLYKRSLTDNITFMGSALQVEELNADDAEGDNITDQMFYIADVHFAEQGVNLFMYYWNHAGNEEATKLVGASKLMTFGAYSNREFGSNMFYDAMFAYQTGSNDATDIDYSGMLLNAEIGMKMDSGTKLSVLVDYTTGDDTETADEVETFNNLLYTGHKWNGYMDYFVGGLSTGLTDIALRVAHPINETMWLKADAHMFMSTEEYADGESNIGNEIDVTLVKKHGDMKIQGGVSFFMPTEEYFGDGAESGTWFYLQNTFGF
jgi:hypothetical protein